MGAVSATTHGLGGRGALRSLARVFHRPGRRGRRYAADVEIGERDRAQHDAVRACVQVRGMAVSVGSMAAYFGAYFFFRLRARDLLQS
jgi:hypothetical protein